MSANYKGVRATAMIAAGFIAAALICYSFYRDKMITGTIDTYNAENEAAVQDQAE